MTIRLYPRHLGSLTAAAVLLATAGYAHAQQLAAISTPSSVMTVEDEGADAAVNPAFRRQVVNYATREAPGTIVIDTPNKFLYFVLGGGKAMRYGIGVGREGFTWSGVKSIARKAEWPDWYPPAEMIARQPYLPRMTAGGPGNPLGARAMYIGGTEYRIHGTNAPQTIGKNVSSGCIRLTNEDVTDLYARVNVGSKVVVLPDTPDHRPLQAQRAPAPAPVASSYAPARDTRAAATWATIRPAGFASSAIY